MDLLELAERCERASGPDRELDIAIIKAVHPGAEFLSRRFGDVFAFKGGHFRVADFRYTASLDAAMTLVPEGWRIVEVGETVVKCSNPWAVRLFQRCNHDRDSQKVRGDAASFALALCAAALRARALPSADNPRKD